MMVLLRRRVLPLLLLAAALPLFVASHAQSVNWAVAMPPGTGTSVSSVAFVDEDFIVMQSGPNYREGTYLELFSVATQQSVWTQPNPCPFTFNSSTAVNPSLPTTLAVFHIQRTGMDRLAYLCWVPGAAEGHVVSVETASGNVTSKTVVDAHASFFPHARFTLGSRASGAYCVKTYVDVICVSAQGTVWKLGKSTPGTITTTTTFTQPWINEYNGTLVVQYLDTATLSLFNLWSGASIANFTLAQLTSRGSVAGQRYLVLANTLLPPCTVVTLDMHTATLSAPVTLQNSFTTTTTSSIFKPDATALLPGSPPEVITTEQSEFQTQVNVWKVPAKAKIPTNATKLPTAPLTQSGMVQSWAVVPGFVVAVIATFGSASSVSVMRLSDGTVFSSKFPRGSPQYFSSVVETAGYIIAAGTYEQDTDTDNRGSAVTVFNSSTGQPLWTKGGMEVVGPAKMPLDAKHRCVMLAPSQGYESSSTINYGSVRCFSL